MKLRSVIFDFGNVICLPPSDEKIAKAAADCGLTVDAFQQAFWADRLPYDGGMEPREYWSNVAAFVGTKFDDALIARMVEHEVGFWNTFDERVLDWIDALRASGLSTGILSNLPIPLGKSLRGIPGFLEHFDHVTFSCELLLVKPQREIYEHATSGLNVAPREALFIDDRPENVEGARAAGLHAELFTTWESFVADAPARYGLPMPAVALRQ